MLCRVAENLFWMGRYVERAIATVRLIDVTAHLELDAGEADQREVDFWRPLLGKGGRAESLLPAVVDVRHHLAFSRDNPNSLVSCIHAARSAARGIRDSISSEMWEALNREYLAAADTQLPTTVAQDAHGFFKGILEGLLLAQGLADCTLTRDEAWQFITLGKYLERADSVTRVLTLQAHLLLSGSASRAGDDLVRWLAVLRSCGSAEAYARYYSLRIEPPRVLEFLLLNPVFPQSVRFSLHEARCALSEVAGRRAVASESSPRAVRVLGLLTAQLEHAAIDDILQAGLHEYLTDVQARIAATSTHLGHTYFRPELEPAGRHMALARAAQIMAAQQQ
jgi:uncharacterized alpha-E superfamily protein